MWGGTVAWWGVDGHGAWVACRWVGGAARLGGSAALCAAWGVVSGGVGCVVTHLPVCTTAWHGIEGAGAGAGRRELQHTGLQCAAWGAWVACRWLVGWRSLGAAQCSMGFL
jgi:hypothetical protein